MVEFRSVDPTGAAGDGGTSDHLKILIEKNRTYAPYFYENKAWVESDVASLHEVKANPVRSKVQGPTSNVQD